MPSICNSQKRGHFCCRKNLIGHTFSSVFISFSLNVFKVEDNQYLRFLNMFFMSRALLNVSFSMNYFSVSNDL